MKTITADKHKEFAEMWNEVAPELDNLQGIKALDSNQFRRVYIACQHIAWRVFKKMRPQRN